MAINVQEPHEMAALIDTQTRKLGAQLLGAMVCREAGEPAPQRLHLRRSVEPEEPVTVSVSVLKLLESLESFVVERRQSDSRGGAADVDAGKPTEIQS